MVIFLLSSVVIRQLIPYVTANAVVIFEICVCTYMSVSVEGFRAEFGCIELVKEAVLLAVGVYVAVTDGIEVNEGVVTAVGGI